MSTIPLELPALSPPALPALTTPSAEDVRSPRDAVPAAVRPRLRRAPALLAPTLPALMMLGLCIAGMTDPPAPPVGGGAASRLHIATQEPVEVPTVPLRR